MHLKTVIYNSFFEFSQDWKVCLLFTCPVLILLVARKKVYTWKPFLQCMTKGKTFPPNKIEYCAWIWFKLCYIIYAEITAKIYIYVYAEIESSVSIFSCESHKEKLPLPCKTVHNLYWIKVEFPILYAKSHKVHLVQHGICSNIYIDYMFFCDSNSKLLTKVFILFLK